MGTIRFDRITLDRTTARRQADGSLVVRGRFARTGCQTYYNDDGTERIEYRAPDVVRASAATFEGVTVTDLHPATMVDASTWSSLARGHVQDVAYVDDGPDGEGWLEGAFHIKDARLADAIDRGERPELSAGYFCDAHDGPGEHRGQKYHCSQMAIVGNHVASIPQGSARAGRGARLLLDSTGNQLPPGGDEPPPGDRRDGKETHMQEFEIVLGGVTYRVTADATTRQALSAHLAQAQGLQAAVDTQRSRADSEAASVVKLTAERDQAKARADGLATDVADLKAKLAEATDQKRIDAAVKARAELVDRARRLGGPAIDCSGSDHELKVRALEAAGVKLSDEARKSPAYVDARIDAALERLQELEDSGEMTINDALDPGAHPQRDSADPLDELFSAHARYVAERNGEVVSR